MVGKYLFAIILIINAFSVNAQWQQDFRLTNNPDSSLTPPNNARCIAAQGNIIHVAWQDNRDGNYEIYYKRSTDDGATWGSDTRLTNDFAVSQRPAIVLSGQYVHIVWNDRLNNEEIYYKQSTDGGITWGVNIRLTNDPNISTYPSVSVLGSVIITAWSDNRDGNYEIYYKRSTDNGSTWSADTRLTNDAAVSLQACVSVSGQIAHITWHDNRNANDEIYYKRSTDGGLSWGADVRLTTLAGASFFASSHASGPYVFTSWVENSDGNPEIYTKRSTDMGLTWEANVRQTNNSANSIRPTVSISGNNFHIVWQDGVDGNDEIYYKSSTDAGISFSGITRLTNNSDVSVYPCHTVSSSGVHAVWRDFRDGNWEVYYKRNPTGNLTGLQNVNNEVPDKFSLSQNYPNPFNPVTKLKFQIVKAGQTFLSVYDIFGREVTMLVNEQLNPGTYEVDFDGSKFSSGVYFYRIAIHSDKLVTNGFAETKKMILVK